MSEILLSTGEDAVPTTLPATAEEKAQLEAEKADVLKRIERYKEKLKVRKMLTKMETPEGNTEPQ